MNLDLKQRIALALPTLEAECGKVKATHPPCDLCGAPDVPIVGATFREDGEPPCFCADCKAESMKQLIIYKICPKCIETDENWTEKILQKYVYN